MRNDHRQNGAVLIISLLILVTLTLLGLSAMRTSTMEGFMARNSRDNAIAFEAADAALVQGTHWVNSRNKAPTECSSEPCLGDNAVYKDRTMNPPARKRNHAWWTSQSTQEFLSANKDIAEAATDPRMIIEVMFISDNLRQGSGNPRGKHLFTITSRGTGSSDAAQVMVKQTVIKRFD